MPVHDSALLLLAVGASTASPIYAAFLSLFGGGVIAGLVTLYKARPDRDLTVASTAEKQVVLSMSMLENERERADRAEKQRDEAEAQLEAAEAELVSLRTAVADLTRRLDEALARTRSTREQHPGRH